MVLCPVAIAVGCKKCPIFKMCPVKGVIGDYKAPAAEPEQRAPTKAKSSPAKSRSAKSRARRK